MAHGSVSDLLHPDMGDWSSDEGTDNVLLLASQQFEASQPPVSSSAEIQGTESGSEDSAIDDILLAASQQFESENDVPISKQTRFGVPVTTLGVEQSRESGVLPKTRKQTSWACGVWGAWAKDVAQG